jgi:Lrp/AsnC family leucine-responsive transcriptional regulator
MNVLDAVDLKILDILQTDGRITNSELAHRIGLTAGPVLTRVSKLETAGFIKRYVAVIDREAMGLPVTAFVSVIMKTHDRESTREFNEAVQALPEVLECHHIAGEEDYLLKVVAANPADYERFVLESLSAIPSVQRVKTTFVLSTPKNETSIPVRGLER